MTRGMETFTLYDSVGHEIKDVTIEFFRPRMDVLTLGRRTFVWRDEFQQYREATSYVVPLEDIKDNETK